MSGCLLNVSLGRCFGHAIPGGDPGGDQGHGEEIIFPADLGTSKCPLEGGSGRDRREECLDFPAHAVAPVTQTCISSRNQNERKHTFPRSYGYACIFHKEFQNYMFLYYIKHLIENEMSSYREFCNFYSPTKPGENQAECSSYWPINGFNTNHKFLFVLVTFIALLSILGRRIPPLWFFLRFLIFLV